MWDWCSGNTSAFQADFTGSNPVFHSIVEMPSTLNKAKALHGFYRIKLPPARSHESRYVALRKRYTRSEVNPRTILAYGVVVTQQTLTLPSQVRILVGQPMRVEANIPAQ